MSTYKLLTTATKGDEIISDKLDKYKTPRFQFSSYIKWVSLVVLTLQTTSIIILFSYSRVSLTGGTLYLASSVVVMAEILKLIFCFCTILWERGISGITKEVFAKPTETFKTLIPATLYALQNNLSFYALKNLDPATYQVRHVYYSEDKTKSFKFSFLTSVLSRKMLTGRLSVEDINNSYVLRRTRQ